MGRYSESTKHSNGTSETEMKWVFTLECRNGLGQFCLIEAWGDLAASFEDFFNEAFAKGLRTFAWTHEDNMSASDRSKYRMRWKAAEERSTYQITNGFDGIYAIEHDGFGIANKQITECIYPKVFAWVAGKYFDDEGLPVREPVKWGAPAEFTMASLFDQTT
jgi:hypothetical protein